MNRARRHILDSCKAFGMLRLTLLCLLTVALAIAAVGSCCRATTIEFSASHWYTFLRTRFEPRAPPVRRVHGSKLVRMEAVDRSPLAEYKAARAAAPESA